MTFSEYNQQDATFLKFIYFCKTLYMFQTAFPSIISSSKLHIQRQVSPALLPAASLAGPTMLEVGIARSESDGTQWRTGGEVKGKYANGVGSQQSCTVSEDGLSSITTADAHASTASSRLN